MKYKKKNPKVVEAIQLVHATVLSTEDPLTTHQGRPGDYLVTVDGKQYIMSKEKFQDMYEPGCVTVPTSWRYPIMPAGPDCRRSDLSTK